MKKLYIQPQTDVCELLPAQILAGSVTGSFDDDSDQIGFGGVSDGSQDPDVKGNSFEFEW